MSRLVTSKGIPLVLALLLVPGSLFGAENSKPPCPSEEVVRPLLSIVALYRQDMEELYLSGICNALEKLKLVTKVKLKKWAYGNEEAGFDSLKKILQEESADIVLGPTDSGVFLRGIKELDEESQIPVVSPLVTAPVVFDSDSTFFSSNVTLTRRTKHLAFSLSKYRPRSIIVLHSNSAFGQQTEAVFRETYLRLEPTVRYRPLQFETRNFGEQGPYLEVNQVLTDRPEALGIFGTREEISTIAKLLVEMNSTLISYRPILFTPIDYRRYELSGHEIIFVSMSATDESDDIGVLSYNTVLLLMEQFNKGETYEKQKKVFLSKLVDRFHGASDTTIENHSTMKFREGRNLSDIHVLKRSATNELSPVEAPDILKFFSLKFTLLYKTRGWWVVASFILVFFVPIILSILDLKGWYRGTVWELFKNKFSLSFMVFNCLIVVSLYLYLAESGRIIYDSPLTALIVAIGPMTFLKSTIFNTATGKAIGLSSFYDNSIKWLNEKLRTKKFQLKQKYINILAYYNSLDGMKDELQQGFSHAKTRKERERLNAQLIQELESAETHLDKRIVCAKRLFEEFKWNLLIDKEFVPPGFRGKDPVDPDEMIKASARYIFLHRDDDVVQTTLQKEVAKVLETYKNEELGITEEKKERPYHAVCLLVKYGNFGLYWLRKAGLLDKDWGKETSQPGMWGWLRSKNPKNDVSVTTVSDEESKGSS